MQARDIRKLPLSTSAGFSGFLAPHPFCFCNSITVCPQNWLIFWTPLGAECGRTQFKPQVSRHVDGMASFLQMRSGSVAAVEPGGYEDYFMRHSAASASGHTRNEQPFPSKSKHWIGNVQGSAKRWSPGCVNAAGMTRQRL